MRCAHGILIFRTDFAPIVVCGCVLFHLLSHLLQHVPSSLSEAAFFILKFSTWQNHTLHYFFTSDFLREVAYSRLERVARQCRTYMPMANLAILLFMHNLLRDTNQGSWRDRAKVFMVKQISSYFTYSCFTRKNARTEGLRAECALIVSRVVWRELLFIYGFEYADATFVFAAKDIRTACSFACQFRNQTFVKSRFYLTVELIKFFASLLFVPQ